MSNTIREGQCLATKSVCFKGSWVLISTRPSLWRGRIGWRLCLSAWPSWLWGTRGSGVSPARPRTPTGCRSRAPCGPPGTPATPPSVGPRPWGGAAAEPGAGWRLRGSTGTLRRLVVSGGECHKGRLHRALGHALGIPRKQARSFLPRCQAAGPRSPPCLCSLLPSPFLPRRASSSLLSPGGVSSPTPPPDSSPSGRPPSRSPPPAVRLCPRCSLSLCSPAGETACCPPVWCSARCHWGSD